MKTIFKVGDPIRIIDSTNTYSDKYKPLIGIKATVIKCYSDGGLDISISKTVFDSLPKETRTAVINNYPEFLKLYSIHNDSEDTQLDRSHKLELI
jgi:hypothetical protein